MVRVMVASLISIVLFGCKSTSQISSIPLQSNDSLVVIVPKINEKQDQEPLKGLKLDDKYQWVTHKTNENLRSELSFELSLVNNKLVTSYCNIEVAGKVKNSRFSCVHIDAAIKVLKNADQFVLSFKPMQQRVSTKGSGNLIEPPKLLLEDWYSMVANHLYIPFQGTFSSNVDYGNVKTKFDNRFFSKQNENDNLLDLRYSMILDNGNSADLAAQFKASNSGSLLQFNGQLRQHKLSSNKEIDFKQSEIELVKAIESTMAI